MANGTGYSAGNLEFTVQQISDKTLSSLDALIAKLKTTMSLLGSTSSISKTLGSTTGGTKSGGGASFEKTNKQLKVSSVSLSKIINKVYFLRNYTKQMFGTFGKMFNLAVDYTETLNLWQVAMRDNRREADEFVKTMNKAYGISTQTLMNYQAIFKNMLSSLGGVSENTSYALSEYLTQMAIDYASLYNTSIERAMTTFQSVLSGQVRPIRSIAGYDITETTIYQLYQQLGGTKTMRQLTQTEKRLLRIYAVFQQMESSGAIGDLNKTLGNTANQMRILSESSKELQTWFGILVEDILAPALPILNAFVITLTNIVKAFVKMRDVELFEGGAVESVKDLNDALDETQGKLLSFDRFEALNSSQGDNNLLGIDENLLSGLSRYESILSKVTGEAQKLAEKWTSWWVDADTGELTEKAQELFTILSAVSTTIFTLITYKLTTKIGLLIGKITGLTTVSKLLNATLMVGTVYLILKLAEAFEKGDYWAGVLYIALAGGAGLILAMRLLNQMSATSIMNMAKFLNGIKGTFAAVTVLVGGIALFVSSLDKLSNTAQILIPVLSALAGVIAAIAVAKAGMTWRAVVSAGAITAGIGMVVGTLASVKQYKTGGLVEDGIFTMNKGEVMGTFDDGTSIVANNQQIISGIKQGVYSAVVTAMRQSGNVGVGDVYLDGRKVGQTTARYSHNENVRTGLAKATR